MKMSNSQEASKNITANLEKLRGRETGGVVCMDFDLLTLLIYNI